ncbi:AAA family ATPase [Roseibacillus persicicus]|uniref:AAA family ATPase n=1 Tax=Roseibacillus persicicus TaxID=454148 RepID=UPI00280C6CCE|nr:AAA family ATPase [Roseibacillus persicicus]MDQ8192516.1 AAA family ATPase [Roseibacillus persicicus]
MSDSTHSALHLARRLYLNWLTPERVHLLNSELPALTRFFGCEPLDSQQSEKEILATFQSQLKEWQRLFTIKDESENSVLENNLAQLSELLRLSTEERQILAYLCVAETFDEFQRLNELLKHHSFRSVAAQIAECLQLPVRRVFALLHQNGKLLTSGLVRRRRFLQGGSSFVLSDAELACHLIEEPFKSASLTSYLGTKGQEPTLQLSDFEHLSPTLEILIRYLRTSLTQGSKGVNVFIHGLPGTGKSELARLLGKTLDCGTFEPSFVDESGDPITGSQRFSRLRCTLSLLKNETTLIVCDEAEDLFQEGRSAEQKEANHKLWINRLLEENEVPVIWLSNHISNLDPAIIRRFDFVFEATIPSRTQRKKIIRNTTGTLLSHTLIKSLSTNENLAPAVVTRAAKVLSGVKAGLSPLARDRAFHLLVSQTLTAQGHPAPPTFQHREEIPYHPSLSASSIDLTELVEGLHHTPTARICLEGPPGTGKSAFAIWLAESLNRKLHPRRLSDLLSRYVGETERAIAEAFQKAQRDGAVLLLDEVDSLLSDRNKAVRTWEVTQVNEMLTQMEAFEGILIATTNRIASLDAASTRRFDLTISLDYLSSQQVAEFFLETFETLQIPPIELDSSILSLPNAAPGDFAALVRRHRFQPFGDAQDLAAALFTLCSKKPDHLAQKIIGFAVK